MSFDNAMELFAHEFEMHPISSWVEEVDSDVDLEDIDSDASKKRKSSDDESPIQQKCPRVSVIVPNPNVPQVGTGKVEPEKEKNPQPEDAGRIQEQDVGLDSPPVLLPEEQNPEPLEPENNDYQDRTAFRERLFSRQYKHRGSNDILQAGQQYKVRIMRLLQHYMKKNGGVTFFMVYKCKLLKYNPEGEEEYTEVYFHSKNRRLLSIEEFEENYEEAIDTINGKLGDYMGESSGWMMDSIKAVNLNIARYNPIRGSSYIPSPVGLVGKKALVNVQNKDQNCFLYSVLASL